MRNRKMKIYNKLYLMKSVSAVQFKKMKFYKKV